MSEYREKLRERKVKLINSQRSNDHKAATLRINSNHSILRNLMKHNNVGIKESTKQFQENLDCLNPGTKVTDKSSILGRYEIDNLISEMKDLNEMLATRRATEKKVASKETVDLYEENYNLRFVIKALKKRLSDKHSQCIVLKKENSRQEWEKRRLHILLKARTIREEHFSRDKINIVKEIMRLQEQNKQWESDCHKILNILQMERRSYIDFLKVILSKLIILKASNGIQERNQHNDFHPLKNPGNDLLKDTKRKLFAIKSHQEFSNGKLQCKFGEFNLIPIENSKVNSILNNENKQVLKNELDCYLGEILQNKYEGSHEKLELNCHCMNLGAYFSSSYLHKSLVPVHQYRVEFHNNLRKMFNRNFNYLVYYGRNPLDYLVMDVDIKENNLENSDWVLGTAGYLEIEERDDEIKYKTFDTLINERERTSTEGRIKNSKSKLDFMIDKPLISLSSSVFPSLFRSKWTISRRRYQFHKIKRLVLKIVKYTPKKNDSEYSVKDIKKISQDESLFTTISNNDVYRVGIIGNEFDANIQNFHSKLVNSSENDQEIISSEIHDPKAETFELDMNEGLEDISRDGLSISREMIPIERVSCSFINHTCSKSQNPENPEERLKLNRIECSHGISENRRINRAERRIDREEKLVEKLEFVVKREFTSRGVGEEEISSSSRLKKKFVDVSIETDPIVGRKNSRNEVMKEKREIDCNQSVLKSVSIQDIRHQYSIERSETDSKTSGILPLLIPSQYAVHVCRNKVKREKNQSSIRKKSRERENDLNRLTDAASSQGARKLIRNIYASKVGPSKVGLECQTVRKDLMAPGFNQITENSEKNIDLRSRLSSKDHEMGNISEKYRISLKSNNLEEPWYILTSDDPEVPIIMIGGKLISSDITTSKRSSQKDNGDRTWNRRLSDIELRNDNLREYHKEQVKLDLFQKEKSLKEKLHQRHGNYWTCEGVTLQNSIRNPSDGRVDFKKFRYPKVGYASKTKDLDDSMMDNLRTISRDLEKIKRIINKHMSVRYLGH